MLYYKTYDQSKPVLLFLHGLLGSATNWHSIASHYAPYYRVIVPDLRNHGKSPHYNEHTYPLMVADLVTLLDQLAISKCNVIGHSMGGKVAMQLALTHPQLVQKLVVVDIAPIQYQHDFADIYHAMLAIDLTTLKNRQEADAIMAKTIQSKDIRQFILQNLTFKKGAWQWRVNIALLRQSMPDIGRFELTQETFQKACLFIRGANSMHIQNKDQEAIQRYFPLAEIKTIQNAGHWVYYEQKHAFLTLLSSFLKNK